MQIVEERRGLRRFDGDADAHAIARRLACRNLEARAHVRIVPIELRRLARGQERAGRPARHLEDYFAGLRRGELHRQNAIFVFDREQLRGGVHDVFGGGEIGALAAQAVRPQRHAHRQPHRLLRAHAHARNQQRASGERLHYPQVFMERLLRGVDDADRTGRG